MELGSILNTTRKSGVYSQGARLGAPSVGGKLLRGNIRDEGDSGSPGLTGFLLKAAKGDQTSGHQRLMEVEESNQVSK